MWAHYMDLAAAVCGRAMTRLVTFPHTVLGLPEPEDGDTTSATTIRHGVTSLRT